MTNLETRRSIRTVHSHNHSHNPSHSHNSRAQHPQANAHAPSIVVVAVFTQQTLWRQLSTQFKMQNVSNEKTLFQPQLEATRGSSGFLFSLPAEEK